MLNPSPFILALTILLTTLNCALDEGENRAKVAKNREVAKEDQTPAKDPNAQISGHDSSPPLEEKIPASPAESEMIETDEQEADPESSTKREQDKNNGTAFYLSNTEIKDTIKKYNSELSEKDVQAISKKLANDTPGKRGIIGVLYAEGFNGSFFYDSDEWTFDVTYREAATASLASKKALYTAKYSNPGIKLGYGYKWILAFVLDGIDIHGLDKTTFVRSFSVTLGVGVTIEFGYMNDANGKLRLILVVPQVGFEVGLASFPKINFRKN